VEARSQVASGARHGRLRERCKEIRKGDQKRSHRSPQLGDKAGRPARKKRMKGKNKREEEKRRKGDKGIMDF
jgi:hypothetical protein